MARKILSLDELNNFTIDTETLQLFWLDKEIVTTMRLPWLVNVAAIVGAFSALGLFIEGLIPLLK